MFVNAEPAEYSVASSVSSVQKFISFQLGVNDTALLPLEKVVELFQVSVADILPVPEVPSCVLGIYNWREEMLWLVDLNAMTGFPPLLGADSAMVAPMTMVVQTLYNEKKQYLGLVVQQVKDIELLEVQQLKTPDSGVFNRSRLDLLEGYFVGDNNEILRLFDAEAIIKAPIWR